LSGSGVWREIKNFSLETFTPATNCVFEEGGLNDIRRSHSTQTFNKIESCLNSVLKKQFVSTSVSSGSASVTRSGSFTGVNLQVYGGFSGSATIPGNSGSFNTTANATWTWTFSGTNVCIIFSSCDPTITRGSCEVRIDGVLIETISDLNQRYDAVSDGVYDNKRGPDTRTYFGLANTSHSIEVKALTTDAVVIDQFSTVAPGGVVFCIEVPKILDYAKMGLDQASDAYVNQVNALRKAVIKKWYDQGFKVYYVPIMTYYQLQSGVTIDGTDLVHPLNAGHLEIYKDIRRHIR
jgi:hypothetical protein